MPVTCSGSGSHAAGRRAGRRPATARRAARSARDGCSRPSRSATQPDAINIVERRPIRPQRVIASLEHGQPSASKRDHIGQRTAGRGKPALVAPRGRPASCAGRCLPRAARAARRPCSRRSPALRRVRSDPARRPVLPLRAQTQTRRFHARQPADLAVAALAFESAPSRRAHAVVGEGSWPIRRIPDQSPRGTEGQRARCRRALRCRRPRGARRGQRRAPRRCRAPRQRASNTS